MPSILDTLRSLHERATKGPWEIVDSGITLGWSSYKMEPCEKPPDRENSPNCGGWLRLEDFKGGTTMCRDIRAANGKVVKSAEHRHLTGTDDVNAERRDTDELIVSTRNNLGALLAVVDAARDVCPMTLDDEAGPYVLIRKDELASLRTSLLALDVESGS